MSTNQENVINAIKDGQLSLSELQGSFAESATAGLVTIDGLEVCYSSVTGQLSGYCTVSSNNSGNPITGLGLVVYSGNGATMYCLQYSNGLNSTEIPTSVGTNLYNPSMGNQALCIVYGWTESGSYYYSQNVTIGSC